MARKGVPALQLAGSRDLEALLCTFVGFQLQLDFLGLWQIYPPDSSLAGAGTGVGGAAATGTGAGLG